MVFKRRAIIGINRIYSTYGNIYSVPELRHVIDELFTHSHLGSALDVTLMLFLYYYLI